MEHGLVELGCLAGTKGFYRLTQPVDELAIPATVEAVLAARIDRLAEREKYVLGTASVIGQQVPEPILKRVVGAVRRPPLSDTDFATALGGLTEAEFLHQEALYPDVEYAFTHPLTQEVAYGSQLGERRRQVHAAVARAIEEFDPDKLDERSALLAHHWGSAGEALPAARWHRRAAVWAGSADVSEGLRNWHMVRARLKDVAESPETLALGLQACTMILIWGTRSGRVEEDVADLLAAGEELAERSDDPRARIHLLTAYGVYRTYQGAVGEAVRILRDAKQLADEVGDPEIRTDVRFALQLALFATGPLPEALSTVDEILELHREDPNLGAGTFGGDPHAAMLAFRGAYIAALGRAAEGAACLQRAIELERRPDDVMTLSASHVLAAFVETLTGDSPEALAHARRAIELAERLGTANVLGAAYGAFGFVWALEERWRDALDALEQSAARGLGYHRQRNGPTVARAWLALGEKSKALSAAQEAVSLAQRSGAMVVEILAQLALARVLSKTEGAGAKATVEQALARACTLVEKTGFHLMKPQIHVERAELARELGDLKSCERELREAHRLFTEVGATGHAERLAKELGL